MILDSELALNMIITHQQADIQPIYTPCFLWIFGAYSMLSSYSSWQSRQPAVANQETEQEDTYLRGKKLDYGKVQTAPAL
jgi:hypothetical protein